MGIWLSWQGYVFLGIGMVLSCLPSELVSTAVSICWGERGLLSGFWPEAHMARTGYRKPSPGSRLPRLH